MYITGDQLRGDTQTVDTQNLPDSVIAKNTNIITKFPVPLYNRFYQNWFAGEFCFIIYMCIKVYKILVIFYIKIVNSK